MTADHASTAPRPLGGRACARPGELGTPAELEAKVPGGGSISGLVVVPPRFSADVERGIAAPIGLFVDNIDGIASMAIEGAVADRCGLSTVKLDGELATRLGVVVELDQLLVDGVICGQIVGTRDLLGGQANGVCNDRQLVGKPLGLGPAVVEALQATLA